MQIQLINNSEDWNDLLRQCKFYTFFHTWEWRNIVFKSYGFKPCYFLIDDSFILPCFKIKKIWSSSLISMPLTEYGGFLPLSENFNSDEILNILENFGKQSKSIIKVEMHPFVSKKFFDNKLNSDLCTYILKSDKPYDQLISSLKKSIRYDIRSAYKNNLKIDKVEGGSIIDLEKIYQVYLHTNKRNMAIPSSFKFLYELSKSKNVHVYTVKDEKNNLISSAIFLEYCNILHYYKSSTYNNYFKLKPVYFLLSEVMKEWSNDKIEYFDFGATRKGDSLEGFKKGWGAEKYDLLRYSNRENSFETEQFSTVRKVWGKMPLMLIKNLSPYLYKYII